MSKSGPEAGGGAASGGSKSAPDLKTGKGLSRRRLRQLVRLAELPAKIPEKLEEGIDKGLTGAAEILRDPVGTAHKVIDTLQAPRGLALGWAIALILPVLLYLIDLGAGSLWQGDDASIATALLHLSRNPGHLSTAALSLPPPSGVPLGILQMALAVRLLGLNEAALRLLPVLSALGCAMCLLAISIDVGVGRHAGAVGGLVLLALPLTYELSHRALPEMLIALASTGAVALVSHSLHGHKFDRHILPIQKETDEPQPLPLRRLPMFFASLGIGAAAFVDPRAGMVALLFALLDMLVSHRYLFRKRRVWAMLAGGLGLTVFASFFHPLGPRAYLHWHGTQVVVRTFLALWHQGPSFYGRYIGPVVIVSTGFGLLLGSLRRASRPLLAWVLVAAATNMFTQQSPPPRGLGLMLPPLALCAAVGLQSPARWLGSLGGLVTAAALFGVIVATAEGDGVLHKSDTLRLLTQSQQHAPADARLCTLAMPPTLLSLYARRPIEEFESVAALKSSLQPGQPFSCLVPSVMVPAFQQAFAALPPEPPKPTPAPSPGSHGPKRHPAPVEPATARAAAPLPPFGSVLDTTLDIEEAPPDIAGPKVALVSR
jgi:hypothetical protein